MTDDEIDQVERAMTGRLACGCAIKAGCHGGHTINVLSLIHI